MSIRKPLGLGLVIGLLAMAFAALPAMASAAQLTDEGGAPLEVPSIIQGSSGNTVTEVAGGGTLACESVGISGELTANSGGTVEAEGLGEDTSSGCTLTGVGPVEVTVLFTSLHLSPTTNTATFDFIVHIPNGPSCSYSGSATVTYTPPASSIHIAGTVSTPTPGCPPSGNIKGDFALTSGGGSVTVD